MEHVEPVEVDGAGGHRGVAQVQLLSQFDDEPGKNSVVRNEKALVMVFLPGALPPVPHLCVVIHDERVGAGVVGAVGAQRRGLRGRRPQGLLVPVPVRHRRQSIPTRSQPNRFLGFKCLENTFSGLLCFCFARGISRLARLAGVSLSVRHLSVFVTWVTQIRRNFVKWISMSCLFPATPPQAKERQHCQNQLLLTRLWHNKIAVTSILNLLRTFF